MFRFNKNSIKSDNSKDINFIKEQIEMNILSIDNIKKFGGNPKYLIEQNERYNSILKTLKALK